MKSLSKFLSLTFALAYSLTVNAQKLDTLDNSKLVELTKAKLGDDIIIGFINSSETKFDCSISAFLKLKKDSVSEKVLAEVMKVCKSSKVTSPDENVSAKKDTPKSESEAASQNVDGCEKDETGDYCFTNSTMYELKVDVFIFANQYSSSRYSQLLIKPGDSKCVYNLLVKTRYNYGAFREVSRGEGFMPEQIKIDNGEMSIERCKIKSSLIK